MHGLMEIAYASPARRKATGSRLALRIVADPQIVTRDRYNTLMGQYKALPPDAADNTLIYDAMLIAGAVMHNEQMSESHQISASYRRSKRQYRREFSGWTTRF